MAKTLQEKAQLLQHLHAQKYLTSRERRQAQILEEYTFLRDRVEGDENDEEAANSVLMSLGHHLLEILDAELVPIPKKSTSETKSAEMRDQKVGAMLDVIMAMTDKDAQLRQLVDLVVRLLRHEDAGIELLMSLNGHEKIFKLLDVEDPQPSILALLAALSAFSAPRRALLVLLPITTLFDFLLSSNPKVREYATHALANFTYELRALLPADAVKRLIAILIKYEDEQIGFQSLRCLTNLAMDEVHRRAMLDFHVTLDTLTHLLKSRHPDYQAQAAWTLANLAATPFEAPAVVELLIERLASSHEAVVYHSIAALANFALLDIHQAQFKNPKLLEHLAVLIESSETAILEETLRTLSRMLAKGYVKDSSFLESLSLACLTLIDPEYELFNERIVVQACWCLAQLVTVYSDPRQVIFDHNGLELLAYTIEQGNMKAVVPTIWVLSGLSELVSSRQKFRDLELLRPLVEFLFRNDSEITVPAARALSNLMAHDAANKKLISALYQKFAVQEPMIMARLASDTRPGPKK